MAKTRVNGYGGAVAWLSGQNADFNSWTFTANQPVDEDTNYGDTITGATFYGAGTIDYMIEATGFIAANASSTAPGLTGAVMVAGPATVTLTAKSGCTEAISVVAQSAAISHSKRAGAVPIRVAGRGSGALTETWAVS